MISSSDATRTSFNKSEMQNKLKNINHDVALSMPGSSEMHSKAKGFRREETFLCHGAQCEIMWVVIK